MTDPAGKWGTRLSKALGELGGDHGDYRRANATAVQRAADGYSPDAGVPNEGAGIRMVANIACVHVPAFCRDGYKNGYDLGKYRVGEERVDPPKTRELVDDALPVPAATSLNRIYFGAAALSEAGIRFYGDLCLVLKQERIGDSTVILDRNSYDLVRAPLAERIADAADRRAEAEALAGHWPDIGAVAAIKVLAGVPPQTRRMTTGQIAGGVLNDEDYLEVLKEGPFTTDDLEAVRIASADSVAATAIRDKGRTGPPPSEVELLFLDQRERAEAALAEAGLGLDVVVTSGRIR